MPISGITIPNPMRSRKTVVKMIMSDDFFFMGCPLYMRRTRSATKKHRDIFAEVGKTRVAMKISFRLFFLLSFLALCPVISHADQPPPFAETDPRILAEKALRAYQMKDLEGYQKLLARPLPFGTSQAKAFSHAKEI